MTVRVGLVLKPTISGKPTKPSLPVSPTSTLLPSARTVRTEANPRIQEIAEFDRISRFMQHDVGSQIHERQVRKNQIALSRRQAQQNLVAN